MTFSVILRKRICQARFRCKSMEKILDSPFLGYSEAMVPVLLLLFQLDFLGPLMEVLAVSRAF